MQLTFGAGDVFTNTRILDDGTSTPNATAVRIAGLQEMSLEFSGDIKEYHGQGRYAIATAMGKVKTSGKIKGALFDGNALNSLYFQSPMTSGTMKDVYADVTGSVIDGNSYTITVSPPRSGTFIEDMGVIGSDGVPFVKVASAPASGQYTVSAGGAYLFSSVDPGKTVYISYTYSYTSANAKRILLSNKAMGLAPSINMLLRGSFKNKPAMVELESIIVPKLNFFSTKNDDFSVPELEFSAQTDEAGFKIATIWLSQ